MIRKFFKRVFYYVAAICFCFIGVLSINLYLTSPTTLTSIFAAIGGFILIEPAVTCYAKKIKDFFEIE